ncbi:MAG: c-type cytochrome domain-containing protein [Pirellulales bacterium]
MSRLHLNRTTIFGVIQACAHGIVLALGGMAFPQATVLAQEAKPVTFDEHVSAIFKRHCWQCHGDGKQEAGLNLSTYANTLKGGSGGAVVASGRSTASRLWLAVSAPDPAERMPPENDPLPNDQLALIKAWIDGGLRQNAGSAALPTRTLSFTPSTPARNNGPPAMPVNLPPVAPAKTARPFPVLALAASSRGPLIAASGYEQVELRNANTQQLLGGLSFPEGEPQVLRFSPSGSVLLAAGGRPAQSGAAVLFDVRNGARLAEMGDESDAVLAADISTDERFVALGGSGRVVKVFSTVDGMLKHTLVKHTDWITAIAFSPDGKLLATADRVGNIHLWDAASGGVVLPLAEHKDSVRALSWRSDSQILASCGEDGQVVWWEVVKGWPSVSKPDAHPPQRPPGSFGRIANGVLDASFGASGELATCGRDESVRVWSPDGSLMKTFELPKEDTQGQRRKTFPLRVVITSDGNRVIAGDSAGKLHSWQIK